MKEVDEHDLWEACVGERANDAVTALFDNLVTGFDPSWISLFHLAICSGTNLRSRRLVPIFYGNLRSAGAQTIWLLRFMLQLTTLLSTLFYVVTTHTNKKTPFYHTVAFAMQE